MPTSTNSIVGAVTVEPVAGTVVVVVTTASRVPMRIFASWLFDTMMRGLEIVSVVVSFFSASMMSCELPVAVTTLIAPPAAVPPTMSPSTRKFERAVVSTPWSTRVQSMPRSIWSVRVTLRILASMSTCPSGTSKARTTWSAFCSTSSRSEMTALFVRASKVNVPTGESSSCTFSLSFSASA